MHSIIKYILIAIVLAVVGFVLWYAYLMAKNRKNESKVIGWDLSPLITYRGEGSILIYAPSPTFDKDRTLVSSGASINVTAFEDIYDTIRNLYNNLGPDYSSDLVAGNNAVVFLTNPGYKGKVEPSSYGIFISDKDNFPVYTGNGKWIYV